MERSDTWRTCCSPLILNLSRIDRKVSAVRVGWVPDHSPYLLWDTYRLHAGVTNDGKGYPVPGQTRTLSCRNYTPFAWSSHPLAQGRKDEEKEKENLQLIYVLHTHCTRAQRARLIKASFRRFRSLIDDSFRWSDDHHGRADWNPVSQPEDAGDRLILLKERTANPAVGAETEQVNGSSGQ